MIRYNNHRNHQTTALFRDGVMLHVTTSQQLLDAIYKRLCAQRFFTHHRVERVTVNQFLAMLATLQLKQYDKAA